MNGRTQFAPTIERNELIMNKKTVKDIDVNGKKVLVRCDFNVPIDSETGKITDNRRIRAALPTIQYLLDHNAKVILCSHLGRPKGEFNLKYSLKPGAEELSKLLNKDVKLAKDVIGEDAKTKAKEYRVNTMLLKDSQYKGRTTLKRIEKYRIKELIIEDLKIYKEATKSEIQSRIGAEIPPKKIWEQINILIAEGKVKSIGQNRWRRYIIIE